LRGFENGRAKGCMIGIAMAYCVIIWLLGWRYLWDRGYGTWDGNFKASNEVLWEYVYDSLAKTDERGVSLLIKRKIILVLTGVYTSHRRSSIRIGKLPRITPNTTENFWSYPPALDSRIK